MMSNTKEHFRIERADDGVVTVWIDVAERSMNVFHGTVIEELERVVEELSLLKLPAAARVAQSDEAAAIVFRSAKPSGFFAGADVNQIAALETPDAVAAVIDRGAKAVRAD